MPRRLAYVLVFQCVLAIGATAQIDVNAGVWDPQLCSGLTTIEQCLGKLNVPLTEDSLSSALYSANPWISGLAAGELAAQGVKSAIPDLLSLLEAKSEPSERMGLAVALGQLGDERGIETLRSYCDNTTIGIMDRLNAAAQLLQFQPESCPEVLMEGLQSDLWPARDQAVGLIPCFTKLSSQESVLVRALLLKSLSDPQSVVRSQAAYTILRLKDTSAIAALQVALAKEPDPLVRNTMEDSLKRLQSGK